MKKFLNYCIILLISIISISCAKEETTNDKYNDLHKRVMDLQSYEATADITYISNKNEVTYTTKQLANIDGRYYIEIIAPPEVAGNVSLFDGTTVYQHNLNLSPDVIGSTVDVPERLEILLTSFIKNYATSNDVTVTVSNFDSSLCTVLEAKISGDHPYISSEKLWVDNATGIPAKLVIYDSSGMERIIVQYKQFEYNPEIDETIYTIKP